MSILPPISESNEGVVRPRSVKRGWLVALTTASLCAAMAYNANPRRRLSEIARPQLRSIPKHTILFDDGTLFAPQGDEPLCDFFTQNRRAHTQIKRLHLHLQSCKDSSAQLEEYFQAKLLANAAQVPYTMTCGGALQDSLMSRLVVDNVRPGQVPTDGTGKAWTAAEVCRADAEVIHLAKETIEETLKAIVPKTAIDDMVIQFDPSVPISTYKELITETQFEHGPIDSIAIVGTGPHLLVQSLERAFTDVTIRTIDEDDALLDLYSRLMYSKLVGVCSTPSLCSYAMLSGVGGFLNQEHCPTWISNSIKDSVSKVELFEVTNARVS
jgi:hypothetical protein